MTVVRTRWSAALTLPTLLCSAALLVSCGGSSSSPPGTPVITLSATGGNFASYRVLINSITLTHTDGTVETLGLANGAPSELVDLATLTDLSELLEAPAVPSGTYKSATFNIDFTALSVSVIVNGQALAAKVLNASGSTPAGIVSVNVTFDPNNPLVVTIGKSARLAIDIDLEASNSIDTSGSTPTVTVQPFLVMTPAPADSTLIRVRGLLVTTQPSSSDYVINTHPLNDQSSAALGAVTVSTGANTYFDVNGTPYTGAAGLTAMASLTENTPVAAYGTLGDLSGITPDFHATAVYAGSGLETPLADFVTGVVSARSGNTLTIHGAQLVNRYYLAACATAYNDTFFNNATVTIDSGTAVTEDGKAPSALGPASISVGQQLEVSGQCSIDSSGNLSLDATGVPAVTGAPAGAVRLAPTRIWGTLKSATAGSASLDVLTLDNFAPAAFNFAGTGTTAADPANYAVNTGTLDESLVAPTTLLRIDGIVSPFGSAPPDFNATAISQGSTTEQRLVIEWAGSGTTTPFTTIGTAGLVVRNDATIGSVHEIRTGPAILDLNMLPAIPLITTVGADQSNLRLAIGSTTLTTGISVFNSASGFASAVSSTFTGTNKIYRLVAVGQLNAAANTFVASRISVALHE